MNAERHSRRIVDIGRACHADHPSTACTPLANRFHPICSAASAVAPLLVRAYTRRLRPSASAQAAAQHAAEAAQAAHTLENAERPPVNQQPALHLAEGRSRLVILLLRERCGQDRKSTRL